ncbi:MAG: sulfotransferase domain-containing protein [Geminicoccaceae bacterium]
MAQAIAWPQKTREFHNHHFDSTAWNDFRFRDDDIIIASYAKSGTTWLQQIIGQLVFRGSPDVPTGELSPWLDLRVPPTPVKHAMLEAQTSRRFVKTHLPVDALVFAPQAKYLFIARDGRDVVWSLYNHHTMANDAWYGALNDTPGRVGPPIGRPPASVLQYFREWLDGDGYPLWSMWETVASWWAIRDLPNVRMVHYNDLKRDLAGEMAAIARFLDIALAPAELAAAVEHSSFAWMKANAAQVAPLGGALWEGGATTFIHQGTNGRWGDVLTPDDIARYERTAVERLGPDCARWLAEGGSTA